MYRNASISTSDSYSIVIQPLPYHSGKTDLAIIAVYFVSILSKGELMKSTLFRSNADTQLYDSFSLVFNALSVASAIDDFAILATLFRFEGGI